MRIVQLFAEGSFGERGRRRRRRRGGGKPGRVRKRRRLTFLRNL